MKTFLLINEAKAEFLTCCYTLRILTEMHESFFFINSNQFDQEKFLKYNEKLGKVENHFLFLKEL